jgi:hypothetical protein
MYKITFKGRDIEPIFLEDEKGKVVLNAYLENKTLRLVADNQVFNTGDIKFIRLVDKGRSETNCRDTTKQSTDYDCFRSKMLSLSPEQRANILRFPKLVWKSCCGEEMPEQVKDEIRDRQLKYFIQNPNCIYANPAIYRDLIPKRLPRADKKGIQSVGEMVGLSMMRVIENAIITDWQLSLTR